MTLTMEIEDQDVEELHPPGREPERPARIGPLVWVAVAVLAVLAGYLVIGRGPAPDSSLDSRPRPGPTVSALPVAGPNQRQYLAVTTICPPVTDGRRTLSVSFEVSDVSEYPVQVSAVTGVLPSGGLHQRGSATQGGSCRQPGDGPPAAALQAGESLFYTLVFDLPRNCPAGYPILARVGFTAGGFPESVLSLLYSDLSVPDFDTCKRARPSATG